MELEEEKHLSGLPSLACTRLTSQRADWRGGEPRAEARGIRSDLLTCVTRCASPQQYIRAKAPEREEQPQEDDQRSDGDEQRHSYK